MENDGLKEYHGLLLKEIKQDSCKDCIFWLTHDCTESLDILGSCIRETGNVIYKLATTKENEKL